MGKKRKGVDGESAGLHDRENIKGVDDDTEDVYVMVPNKSGVFTYDHTECQSPKPHANKSCTNKSHANHAQQEIKHGITPKTQTPISASMPPAHQNIINSFLSGVVIGNHFVKELSRALKMIR